MVLSLPNVLPATALLLTILAPGPLVEDASAKAPARTSIQLTLIGCDGCRVQPVQNKDGDLTYSAHSKTVVGDRSQIMFSVPTARTDKMAILVYAPFDEAAQGGIPAVVALGFRGKKQGSVITRAYASTPHHASGCWAGTQRSHVRRTIVVRKIRTKDTLLGPGRHTSAAAYVTRTLPARPFYWRIRQNSLHASDPSICK